MHLQVAGRVMSFVFLPGGGGVQLLTAAGRALSVPITPGEAGIGRDHRGRHWYHRPPTPSGHRTETGAGPCGDIGQRKRDTLRLIETLTHSDRVHLTVNGRTYAMSVAGTPNRTDRGRGPWESTGVICSLGPNRWSVRVDVEDITHGRYTLTKTGSAKTITIYRTYYRPEDIGDGDIGRENTPKTILDCYDWRPPAETVADFLRSEGLTRPSATDWGPRVWYGHPDGSYADHTTGYHCEPSAHLAGFTDAESRDIFRRITTGG